MDHIDPTTGEVTRPPLDKLAAALAKAQATMEGAAKNQSNPHFGSKYADLAAVWDAIREPLTAHGLSVVQLPMETDGTTVKLRTVLLHESGQSIDSIFVVRPLKADPQGCMSALTYARRGGLMAIVGIAPEDDDGNAASAPAPKRAPRPQTRADAPPPPEDDDFPYDLPGAPAPADGGEPPAAKGDITDAQVNAIRKIAGTLALDPHAAAGSILNRPVAHLSALSKRDGSTVITALQAREQVREAAPAGGGR